MIHLSDLSLSFEEGVGLLNDRRIESDELILNALEPPQDLEKLRISYYGGTTMSPIWLASLTTLKELYLRALSRHRVNEFASLGDDSVPQIINYRGCEEFEKSGS